jgi:hypothetical protein
MFLFVHLQEHIVLTNQRDSYLHPQFFEGVNMNLVDWLRQYAPEDEQTETFLRGFLGRTK